MMSVFRFSLAAILVVLLPSVGLAQDVLGLWRTEATKRGYLEIEIQTCGETVCGTIVGARNPAGETGPYEHLGRQMIWGMRPVDNGRNWSGGKIWDPRNGKTFNSRMELGSDGLLVSGCVLGICQSQTWQRLR